MLVALDAIAPITALLLLLSVLSPLCRLFTIIYLKQTMFLGYIVLQLFHIYSLCCMYYYYYYYYYYYFFGMHDVQTVGTL